MRAFIFAIICSGMLLAFFGASGENHPIIPLSPSNMSLPRLMNVNDLVPPTPTVSKTVTDSLYLMGGPGELSGKFQDESGLPDRQGWTGVDNHQTSELFWQVSNYNAAALDPETVDNHAWWCGDVFEPCSEGDTVEGYGNNWHQYLDWYGTVPNPASNVTVRVQAIISYDIEPGEDFLYLQVENPERMETLDGYSFSATAEVIDVTVALTPEFFVGESGDQIHLRWSFNSDGAWSDEDCLWRTAGAAQIDLIEVSFDQGSGPVQIGTTETCESGDALQWAPVAPQGPGDFSKVWPSLDDAGPTIVNNTPQFAFIDDGEVVPGTGGYLCTTHCYGPGDFIVNPEGGVSDLWQFVDNSIWSPVLSVPAGDWNAAQFAFDQYVHADITNGDPYIFGVWHVRSTSDPAGESGWSDWQDHNLVLWGNPRYVRNIQNVSELLVPGFTHVQLALGVRDYHYNSSHDGTPAPYFDNVSFKVYKNLEPSAVLIQADGSGDYPTIQTAINAVASLDTVMLGDGVYTGEGNRDLYYMGKEITITSESGNPEDCIIDLQGAPGDEHRGVNFSYEEGAGSVLSGVTIAGGYFDQPWPSLFYSGSAIACREGSSPTIDNCIFRDNRALGDDQQGGAILCDNASPVISNCIFEGNQAVDGAAISATGLSSPVISNSLFFGNEASHYASGVLADHDDVLVTISSCTFYGNIHPYYTGTLVSYFRGRFNIDHTILASGESGFGVTITYPEDIQFACTNIYGNPAGDWYGHFAIQLGVDGNINLDPVFCLDNNPGNPFGIHEDSPCSAANSSGCGLIGYADVACGQASAVDDPLMGGQLPLDLACYPNPFNPRTTLSFNLPQSGPVELKIYGVDGRLVNTLINSTMESGSHEIHWDGRDDQGRAVASGVFFGRLKTGDSKDSLRMVLIR